MKTTHANDDHSSKTSSGRSKERQRLDSARENGVPWKKWGPYLSERQWGTVREDYSNDGNAWDFFPHDHARSRTYRWGEDGLAGISDDTQQLCFALSLWNTNDPILKERLFGLTGPEGNHGEDVKEYYFYLDNTPTHSYQKYLYKYPQQAFPYNDLVATNASRGYQDQEYELLDTGVFDDDRYFDVQVEYAKAAPEDLLIQISVTNRSAEAATLRVLPTLWFRNTWFDQSDGSRPSLRKCDLLQDVQSIRASHTGLGDYVLHCEDAGQLLFTENETNNRRIFRQPNDYRFVKDGFHDYVVDGKQTSVNPNQLGTKAAADYPLSINPGCTSVVRLRLAKSEIDSKEPFGEPFDRVFNDRRAEADEFYNELGSGVVTGDSKRLARQALAGMLWSKQYYEYDVQAWIDEHGSANDVTRNRDWSHMVHHDVISMPDKWEYPWYAVWDLAFHCLPLAYVDVDFAKQQLELFLSDRYQHPSGQIPAYEWNFGDVNPPVHAYAVLSVYRIEKETNGGQGDLKFLKHSYDRLCRDFEWWERYKDPSGRKLFEGGFLGLDNIGVFDRSATLPTGGHLEQSDGTSWMVFYAQNMLEIALELARVDNSYEDHVVALLDRCLSIAGAMDLVDDEHAGMWDHLDGFFYDVLRFPDGSATRLKVRSLVGLLPICATTIFESDDLAALPHLQERCRQLVSQKIELTRAISPPERRGVNGRALLAVCNEEKLRRVLSVMLDESEFFSDYGIRSLSKTHADHPYVFHWDDQSYQVRYLPAESDSGMFGGNSNWRGPIWAPINIVLIRSLARLYSFYGDDFVIECPTGSGRFLNLYEVSEEIASRLVGIFLRDKHGRRAVYGATEKFQKDPHWRDHLLFYEYFHGDNGAGIGASHQTGWTGCIALLLVMFQSLSPEKLLKGGKGVLAKALASPPESSASEPPLNTEDPSLAKTDSLHPVLFQVNTRVLLTEISEELDRPATLDDLPDIELDRLKELGFEWVYLLGVWKTGQHAREISRANPQWRVEYEDLLDDLTEDDICGSCFAVTEYEVSDTLGGNAALERFRERLHARGMRLMLDFVPNHTAPDHPWVNQFPDYYIKGTEDDLQRQPDNYISIDVDGGQQVFAHGRDPYFPGWPDTLQLNFGNPELRLAMQDEILNVSRLCDGLRCDMAMLVLPEVFQRTWGIATEPFWPDAINRVHKDNAKFQFMAEVYWQMEHTLQDQGFDYTYDKDLYDHLRAHDAAAVHHHLVVYPERAGKSARFMENHDEPRAAATFDLRVHQASALITYLTPGLRFFHHGQFEGWTKRISIHLQRGPDQPLDRDIARFYRRLLRFLRLPAVRLGNWRLLDCVSSTESRNVDQLIAFQWESSDGTHALCVINFGEHSANGAVQIEIASLSGQRVQMTGRMGTPSLECDGDRIQTEGLEIQLPPWGYHTYEISVE